jgi:hypothetical protein
MSAGESGDAEVLGDLYEVIEYLDLDQIPGDLIDTRTQKPVREMLAAAFHEAGHAVLCLLRRVTVSSAAIGPEYSENGDVNGDIEDGIMGRVLHDDISDFSIDVKVALAGLSAESQAMGYPPNLRGARSDLNRVDEIYSKQGYGTLISSRERRTECSKVDDELWAHWPAVVLIAHALFERRSVDGQSLEATFARAIEYIRMRRSGQGAQLHLSLPSPFFDECIRWLQYESGEKWRFRDVAGELPE